MAWLKDGCVLWLQFDEEKGDVAYDQSGIGNNGGIYGATRVKGKIGGALDFNGVDNYVEIPDSDSFRFPNEVTFEVWVFIRALPEWKEIVAKPDHNTGLLSEAGTLGFSSSVWIAGARQKLNRNVGTELNKWHHVASTYVGETGEHKLYVNGQLANSLIQAKGTIDSKVGTNVFLGSKVGESNFLNGLIDELRIYNRALSAKEIFSHYMYALTHVKRA